MREAVELLAKVKEKAVLQGFGLSFSSDEENSTETSSSSSSGTDEDCLWISDNEHSDFTDLGSISLDQSNRNNEKEQLNVREPNNASHCLQLQSQHPHNATEKNRSTISPIPDREHLLLILKEKKLNWFAFVGELTMLLQNHSLDTLSHVLNDISDHLVNMDLTYEEKKKVEFSRQAYLEYERQKELHDESRIIDDDLGNPDDLLTQSIEVQVKKQQRLLKRQTKIILVSNKVERRLLKRKLPKAVSRVLRKFPNIGRDVEESVSSRKVGDNAWRRTGVLKFDGNAKTGPRVTFKRIQEHLQQKYNTKLGYGTVVQLCVVRNKHRLSARRYKGVARITCRRARKGFSVKMNPDSHWSNAVYKGLDEFQLKDGRDTVVLNRDYAAGFRLDTTYTHKQHKGVQLIDQPDLTTRTDFVNSYTALLQTTSYLFQETATTPKVCVGVVKPHIVYEKSPVQHMADLQMLEHKEELSSVIKDLNGKTKSTWFVRVDGAGDEGPSHKEVEFLWTEKHLNQNHHFTCVTTRHSGGSYLNPVELMNGCLAVAHSNLYIPSTLGGQVHNAQGLDEDQLKRNLDLATDVYISRVQGAPCGDANIQLEKGTCDTEAKELLERRNSLLIFLSGKAVQKQNLKKCNPELYKYFGKVWSVHSNHKCFDLSHKYFLVLDLCYKESCPHKRCMEGSKELRYWFNGGPPLTYFPLPVPDPLKPWGGKCDTCQGHCAGHYMQPLDAWSYVQKHGNRVVHVEPPSTVIQKAFNSAVESKVDILNDASKIENLARKI